MIVRLLRIFAASALLLTTAALMAAEENKDAKRYYLAISTGGSWYQDMDLSGGVNGSVGIDTGWTLNGAVGGYIGEARKLRVEVEGVHNRSDIGNFNGASSNGTIYNYGLMANLLYDFHTDSKWIPYIGGGIGFTEATVDKLLVSGATAVDDSDVAFSWQLKAGVAYQFNPKVAATLGYRYLDSNDLSFQSVTGTPVSSDGTMIQNLEIGVRYDF